MSDHLPECPAFCPYPDMAFMAPDSSLPKCRGGDCTLCDELECVCVLLRACEQRSYRLGIEVGKHDGWVAGHAAGVAAARDAVAAIPAPYKVLGEYDTYSPYHEGKSGMQDAALAAIDALLEVSL